MKSYTVYYSVCGEEDSIGFYKDWSFRDVYRDILHVLKYKAVLENELTGYARVTAEIYNGRRYIGLVAVEKFRDLMRVFAIRKEDVQTTIIRGE